tara:strand:- start:1038 stop:1307 length:270 start_codon:yes stop_codon:yes gene_type:complete
MSKKETKKDPVLNKMNADVLLEECKGTMQNCIIAGVDETGNVIVRSSVPNLPFMHWMLNRSVFELGLFEKQNVAAQNEKAPESEVDPKA